jgi:hypothetical protein
VCHALAFVVILVVFIFLITSSLSRAFAVGSSMSRSKYPSACSACWGSSFANSGSIMCVVCATTDPIAAYSQKNKDGLIDALYIFDIEMSDAVSKFIFCYCGDLINHEPRKSSEAIAFVRRNRNTKQRRFSWIGCHDANRDGFGSIEAVILQNDRRRRLTGVILGPGDGPYFSTSQLSPGCNEIVSIKS